MHSMSDTLQTKDRKNEKQNIPNVMLNIHQSKHLGYHLAKGLINCNTHL